MPFGYFSLFKFVGVGASCLLLGLSGFNRYFTLAPIFCDFLGTQGSRVAGQLIATLIPRFLFIKTFIRIHLFVLDDSLTSLRF